MAGNQAKTAFSEVGPRMIQDVASNELRGAKDAWDYSGWHTPLGRGVWMAQRGVERS